MSRLTTIVMNALQRALAEDQKASQSVVKAVSLQFWDKLPQWIQQFQQEKPFLIALAGPSGCGKSVVRDALVSTLAQSHMVSAFTQDNYYIDFADHYPQVSLEQFYDQINLDDPIQIQFEALINDLRTLKQTPLNETIWLPKLIYGTPTQKPTSIPQGLPLHVSSIVVTEGIHAFLKPELCALYDLKLYIDVDESSRRSRWLARNQRENRGTTQNMWQTTVEALHQHILPTRSAADLVINNSIPKTQVQQFITQLVRILKTTLEKAA